MKVSLKKIITSLFACILFTVSMISNITVSAACQPKLYLLANNMRTYTAKPGETVTITYNVDAPDHVLGVLQEFISIMIRDLQQKLIIELEDSLIQKVR